MSKDIRDILLDQRYVKSLLMFYRKKCSATDICFEFRITYCSGWKLAKLLLREGLVEKVKVVGRRGNFYQITNKGKEVAEEFISIFRILDCEKGKNLEVIDNG